MHGRVEAARRTTCPRSTPGRVSTRICHTCQAGCAMASTHSTPWTVDGSDFSRVHGVLEGRTPGYSTMHGNGAARAVYQAPRARLLRRPAASHHVLATTQRRDSHATAGRRAVGAAKDCGVRLCRTNALLQRKRGDVVRRSGAAVKPGLDCGARCELRLRLGACWRQEKLSSAKEGRRRWCVAC